MTQTKFPHPEKQTGLALVVGLIMLLVLTLIGVQSLRTTTLGEKMTRNTLDRGKALEAAEIALLTAEELLGTDGNADDIIDAVLNEGSGEYAGAGCQATFDSKTGFCVPARQRVGTLPATITENWVISSTGGGLGVWADDGNHLTVAEDDINVDVKTTPKYIIEFMGYTPSSNGTKCDSGDGSIESADLDWPFCEDDERLFRITALATAGANENARVMLQSTYVVP